MDNAMMIGLSRQMTLRRSMDVVANNIANANTAGFKVESLLLEAQPAHTAEHSDGPAEVQFVDTWGMARDFRQGQLDQTGRPLDLAIEGEGFFAVEVNGDQQYTRDGRFQIDATGQIVASDGAPVLEATSRAPILTDPANGPIAIVDGGAVMQGGVEIGRIGVFDIANLSGLEKSGNGRYLRTDADGLDDPEALLNPTVHQGYVENSNVSAVLELTEMMNIMRSYQSVSKFLKDAEDLNRRSIERLGRI